MWEAHSDVVKAIKYINVTDEPLVFTAGLDRMACIWDLEGNMRGKLLQGYMMKEMKSNYLWDFPLHSHRSQQQQRQSQVQDELKKLRDDRNEDRTYKKQAFQAIARIAHKTTSLGFMGETLVGLGEDPDTQSMDDREHSNPASYVMNKHQHSGTGSGPFGQSIYDDTGRGKNRTKPYLLQDARDFIAKERRRQEKLMA